LTWIEPFVYGSTVLMPAVRTDWGAKTTLLADITASQTSFELSDASRFPASGTILIDDEKISYTSKSGNVLNGLTRGASGTAGRTDRKRPRQVPPLENAGPGLREASAVSERAMEAEMPKGEQ
jgi:hypothetical protein